MLKIEKVNRHHDYSIELRKREVFFNRTLLKSLLFASFLHLLAILIFHIGPFKILNQTQFSPAFVETETHEVDQQIIAKIDEMRKLSRFPFAPRTSIPVLPPMPAVRTMRHMENIQVVNFLDNPFLKVERDMQHEKYFAKRQEKSDIAPFQITLTGQLEGRKFEVKEGLQSLEDGFNVIYSVKVENKTGRIFFAEPKYQSANNPHLIEKLLKEIRFEKETKGFVTSGDIEITFRGVK